MHAVTPPHVDAPAYRPRPTLPAWQHLQALAASVQAGLDLRHALATDPTRTQRLAWNACGLHVDLSRQPWTDAVLHALLALAQQCHLPDAIAQLVRGTLPNPTEGRMVQHVAWRAACTAGQAPPTAWGKLLDLAQRWRDDATITDVVHIGIGGSALGPELALQALRDQVPPRLRVHFVSNLDPLDLQHALAGLVPRTTRFVVVSKSWTTAETQRNAAAALAWCARHGQSDALRHFVAVTARPDLARQQGYGYVLTLPDGVGGRFSLWTAVGLPVAAALGPSAFTELLAGAAAMDQHLAAAPLSHNLPVLLALLDVWNATFLRYPSRCVVPYHHGLRSLPAYLQQLEMESNGKRVGLDGQALPYPTAPAVWGAVGSNAQHSFFQWLHQGTQPTPVELLLVRPPRPSATDARTALCANAQAQSDALLHGAQASSTQLPGHQDYPGNRPSTLITLDQLTPHTLGALLALYEHRTFAAGWLWGVNSFDQWGVELGKKLATRLLQQTTPCAA